MTSTVFVDGQTLIEASWLQDVNDAVYNPGTITASSIANVPNGNIVATDVQAAIDELDTEKQIASSKLTDIAALAVTDGNIIVGNGTTWVAEAGATARASLGLTIGTDVMSHVAPGTTGNILRSNGTSWTSSSSGLLGNSYTGTTAALTDGASDLFTIAHGLGSVPKLVKIMYECINASAGWSTGERVCVDGFDSNYTSAGFGWYADSTNIYIRTYGYGLIFTKSTGFAAVVTESDWKLYVEAYV